MKSITSFSITNNKPVLYVSDKTLESIKHIVSIAPQEAQWFHTVTQTTINNQNALILSERLYIPKQNTSLSQVDSTSSMMIEFYNELKEEFSDLNIVNQKLSTMTCWCHSHHNMAPHPSAQDVNQFDFFVNSALQQGQSNPQVMLIFNKKNQFYSKMYDPSLNLTYEGLDIVKFNDYDFSYIDKAAKEKFMKPKLKTKFISNPWASKKHIIPNMPQHKNSTPSWDPSANYDINSALTDEFILKAFPDKKSLNYSAKIKTNKAYDLFVTHLEDSLSVEEIHSFYFLLTEDYNSLKSSLAHNFSHINAYNYQDDILMSDIEEYMKNTNKKLSFINHCYFHTLQLTDLEGHNSHINSYIKENFPL